MVQSSEYIPAYFHTYIPKILPVASSLSRLNLSSVLFIYGIVADLIYLPQMLRGG